MKAKAIYKRCFQMFLVIFFWIFCQFFAKSQYFTPLVKVDSTVSEIIQSENFTAKYIGIGPGFHCGPPYPCQGAIEPSAFLHIREPLKLGASFPLFKIEETSSTKLISFFYNKDSITYGIYQQGSSQGDPLKNVFEDKVEIGCSRSLGNELLHVMGSSNLDGVTTIGTSSTLSSGTNVLSILGKATIQNSATIGKTIYLNGKGLVGTPYNRIQSDDRLDFYNWWEDPNKSHGSGYSLVFSLEASASGNGGRAIVNGGLESTSITTESIATKSLITESFRMDNEAWKNMVLTSDERGEGHLAKIQIT